MRRRTMKHRIPHGHHGDGGADGARPSWPGSSDIARLVRHGRGGSGS